MVEDGRTLEQPVTAEVCDFCFDKRVAWDYEADDFEIEQINFASAGGWAVCQMCAIFVQGGHRPALATRIIHSWQAMGMKVDFALTQAAGMIVEGFFDNAHRRYPGGELVRSAVQAPGTAKEDQ